MPRRKVIPLVVALMLSAACTDNSRDRQPAAETRPSTTTTAEPGFTVAVAGDVACAASDPVTPHRCQHAVTAALISGIGPDAVVVPGDVQYPTGAVGSYEKAFGQTWGKIGAPIFPAPGNHDFATKAGAGYFAYFGSRAGEPGKGWYAADLGPWALIVLNSNCRLVGCAPGGEQYQWLTATLARLTSETPNRCVVAVWHHPRYSSGLHGSDATTEALWRTLSEAGADLVLAGHDHSYERFEAIAGLPSFVVGTGGQSLYPILGRETGSVTNHDDGFGVLQLTLRAAAYDWRWVGLPGDTFTDEGSGRCQ